MSKTITMRLINTSTYELHEFIGDAVPPYVILSHTWGAEEVTFQEMVAGNGRQKLGFRKIELCCQQGLKDGFNWAWVDTCAIDKTSSAELSEAINSMYRWYKMARICYVYLTDTTGSLYTTVVIGRTRETSRWFRRGWTLQELIAPNVVQFFDSTWSEIGTKRSLANEIYDITKIDPDLLAQRTSLSEYSIAQRFSWASLRQTTRQEDRAYSLLGMFDVNMPLLYGEGTAAFKRLQRKILKSHSDPTIFAWSRPTNRGYYSLTPYGVLAQSLDHFSGLHQVIAYEPRSAYLETPETFRLSPEKPLRVEHRSIIVDLFFRKDTDSLVNTTTIPDWNNMKKFLNMPPVVACIGTWRPPPVIETPTEVRNEIFLICLFNSPGGLLRHPAAQTVHLTPSEFMKKHERKTEIFSTNRTAHFMDPDEPLFLPEVAPRISLTIRTGKSMGFFHTSLLYWVSNDNPDGYILVDLADFRLHGSSLGSLREILMGQTQSHAHEIILTPGYKTSLNGYQRKSGICALYLLHRSTVVWTLFLYQANLSEACQLYITSIPRSEMQRKGSILSSGPFPCATDDDRLQEQFTYDGKSFTVSAKVRPSGCRIHGNCKCRPHRVDVSFSEVLNSTLSSLAQH